MNDNIDKVIQKLLTENMTPAKIKSYSHVIASLKGIAVQQAPNTVPDDTPNDPAFTEDEPFDISEVEGIQINNGTKEGKIGKVTIHKNPTVA